MARYAVVRDSDSVITNIASWDGVSSWTPGVGLTSVADPSGLAQVGGTYVAPDFFPAEPVDPPDNADVAIPIGQLHQAIETASATLVIDLGLGWRIGLTLNHTLTAMSLTNVPEAGKFCAVTFDITNSGAFDIAAWPTGLKWVGGAEPVITSGIGKLDTILLTTDDAGTEWRAYIGAQNMM